MTKTGLAIRTRRLKHVCQTAIAFAAVLAFSLQALAPLAAMAAPSAQWLIICSDGVLKQVRVTLPAGETGGAAPTTACPDCLACPAVAVPPPDAAWRAVAPVFQRSQSGVQQHRLARTSRHAMAEPGPSRAPPPYG